MPMDESFFGRYDDKDKGKPTAVRVIIEGRVQKVGLRHWIKRKATQFKISGWVRNRMNSSIEAMFYGNEESVSEMVKLCHQGPSFAHVKRVKEFPQTDVGNPPTEFTILPTI